MKRYPPSYRNDAVGQVRALEPDRDAITTIATKLNIPYGTLRAWVAIANVRAGLGLPYNGE